METKQEYWGGLAAGSFFLVAAAAMMFVTLAVWDYFGAEIAAHLNGWASLLAVVMAACGGLLLMVEAGNKAKAYLIIANPASLASKNAVMMTLFMGLAVIYASFFFDFIPWAGLVGLKTVTAILGIIAALMAVIIPAFELGEARARAFWNTSALVPVFLITSTVSGLATLILVASVMGLTGNAAIDIVDKALFAFIVMQLVSVWAYVRGMEHTGAEEARLAAENILHGSFKGSFWGGVMIVGTIIPMPMFLFTGTPTILIIKAVLILIGGVCFRTVILEAAVRKSIPGEENEWVRRDEAAALAIQLEKRWQEKAVSIYNGSQE